MIKVIKIEYFDQFKCSMDRCPDNCCDEKWSISIDEETYNKYLTMEIDDLDNKIRPTSPHTIIKKNGKCPFATDNGLCRIHKNYGEDFLSNTCKTYPRFVSEYGDVFIENLGLSCPEVARTVVLLDHKCQIVEKIYYETEKEINKSFRDTEEEIIMKAILECFYNSDSVTQAVEKAYGYLGKRKPVFIELELDRQCPLLLQNIGICYLFERLMLQSKKDNPDYSLVIDRFCVILEQFQNECYQMYGNCEQYTEEQLCTALYKTMRVYDHEI